MSADLDTRTDVYSLGALLYELLCGRRRLRVSATRPFRSSCAASATRSRRRRARASAPTPPIRAPAPSAATSEPARLRRELAGELDWIVARAMAKERERRYGSAAELADDLERLARRPAGRRRSAERALSAAQVSSPAPRRGDRGGRRCWRRLSPSAWRWRSRRAGSQPRSRCRSANAARPQPRLRLPRGAARTARSGGRARCRRQCAPGPRPRRRADRATSSPISPRSRRGCSRPSAASSSISALFDQAAPVLDARARSCSAQPARAGPRRRRRRAAEAGRARLRTRALRRVAEVRRSRRWRCAADAAAGRPGDPEIPEVAESLDLVALLRRQAGRLDAAEQLHREALAIQLAALGRRRSGGCGELQLLGIVRRWGGDFAGAETAYRVALGIWRRAYGDDHPQVAMALNNLALVVHVRGDHAEARRLFEELLPLRRRLLGPEHPDYQVTLANYGKLLHDSRDLDGRGEGLPRGARDRRAARSAPSTRCSRARWPTSPPCSRSSAASTRRSPLAQRALAIRRQSTASSPHGRRFAQPTSPRSCSPPAATASPPSATSSRRSSILHRRLGRPARDRPALERLGTFRMRVGDRSGAVPLLEEAVGMLRADSPGGDRRLARAEVALGACLTGSAATTRRRRSSRRRRGAPGVRDRSLGRGAGRARRPARRPRRRRLSDG